MSFSFHMFKKPTITEHSVQCKDIYQLPNFVSDIKTNIILHYNTQIIY